MAFFLKGPRKMLVLVLEDAPPRLRGRLSTMLLEVRPGVYAVQANSKTRCQLWDLVCKHIEQGSAVLVWPDPENPAGVDFLTTGLNRRTPIVLDGVRLVNFNRAHPDKPEGVSVANSLVDFLTTKISI